VADSQIGPTSDSNGLTYDETGGLRREERDGPGDVFGLPEAIY
jgi:hypothetical protein